MRAARAHVPALVVQKYNHAHMHVQTQENGECELEQHGSTHLPVENTTLMLRNECAGHAVYQKQ